MFLSICAFSFMDVIVKWSSNYPIGQVMFFRGLFGILPIIFLVPKTRFRDFYKTNRPGLHLIRCCSGLIALAAIFLALSANLRNFEFGAKSSAIIIIKFGLEELLLSDISFNC